MKKQIIALLFITFLLAGIGTVKAQMNAAISTNVHTISSINGPLDLGSQGDAVTALQQFLITKGYLQVASPTGFYGNMTAQAVSAFQGANDLSQVGRVGPKTLSLLNQLLSVNSPQQQTPSPIPSGVGTLSLSQIFPTGVRSAPQAAPGGCAEGNLFNPLTGASCGTPEPVISGCSGTNAYNTLTGKLCGGSEISQQAPGFTIPAAQTLTYNNPQQPQQGGQTCSLQETLDPATPVSQNISSGSIHVHFTDLDLTAVGCDVKVNSLGIDAQGTVPETSFASVFVYDNNGTEIGSPLTTIPTNLTFSPGLIIPVGTTKEFKIFADVGGSTGQTAIVGSTGVNADDDTTGAPIGTGLPFVWGNTMTIQ